MGLEHIDAACFPRATDANIADNDPTEVELLSIRSVGGSVNYFANLVRSQDVSAKEEQYSSLIKRRYLSCYSPQVRVVPCSVRCWNFTSVFMQGFPRTRGEAEEET